MRLWYQYQLTRVRVEEGNDVVLREALDQVVLMADLTALVRGVLLCGSDLVGSSVRLASDLYFVSISQHDKESRAPEDNSG